MSSSRPFFITTAIPYVNAAPHLGHALELVQADVLARHRRLRDQPVRFLTGTDDNALKNVAAARAADVPVREFVRLNAAQFSSLREVLDLSFDDFISTSSDPRHVAGVRRLWRECSERGDFYRRNYEGLYCIGCEQFYPESDLPDGLCPEHGVAPELVREDNWFFRLSRYADDILAALESGRVRVEPAERRNEVIAFVRAGLSDFSVSRPAARSEGWGIRVPGDPEQIIYVWWDALTNYVTALDYGGDCAAYETWWTGSAERVHVIGKGIVRFHAVYWLALLLSAGQPLPTTIFVHAYLSLNGAKLSKTAGNSVDPELLVGSYGVDAVRWWLLREVARVSDTDFTEERLIARANLDLANGLGNLVNRTVSLVHKYRGGLVPEAPSELPVGGSLAVACASLPGRVDDALASFDFRAALDAAWSVVDEGNRLVESHRPWELARLEAAGDTTATAQLDGVLAVLVSACRLLARELAPFVPAGADRLRAQLGDGSRLNPPAPTFPRLDPVATGAGRMTPGRQ